jgi:hypothetical protein
MNRAAIHEAGHCAGYLRFGGKVKSTVLLPGHEGHTIGLSRHSTDTPQRYALRCLTGPMAEQHFTGSYEADFCMTDFEQAAAYARKARLSVAGLWPVALRIVERYEDMIQIIAAELDRCGKLSGAEIERLLQRRA